MIYRFVPLLKQTIWGGDRIVSFKHLDVKTDHVGESWELSGVAGSETVVAEGPYAGHTPNELVALLKHDLVGRENYARFGNEFPLLVKFIDAHSDLSIQVHPNDEVARRHGKEHGKSEMWYCLQSDSSAGGHAPKLYCGLRQPLTPEAYKQHVANGTITEALAGYEVHEGDVFYIPAGRIHAIGAGCFVTEIQQTCDVTYRIYDYNRRDSNGQLRQLHTAEAAEAIDYSVYDDYRTCYVPQKDMPQQLVTCPYFTTAVYDLTEPMLLDYSDLDSFVILIALKGEGTITDNGRQTALRAGETVLLSASTKELMVEGEVKLLEAYV